MVGSFWECIMKGLEGGTWYNSISVKNALKNIEIIIPKRNNLRKKELIWNHDLRSYQEGHHGLWLGQREQIMHAYIFVDPETARGWTGTEDMLELLSGSQSSHPLLPAKPPLPAVFTTTPNSATGCRLNAQTQETMQHISDTNHNKRENTPVSLLLLLLERDFFKLTHRRQRLKYSLWGFKNEHEYLKIVTTWNIHKAD